MRLLLTGATGFVGRNLLLKALELPYEHIYLPLRNTEKLRTFLQRENISLPSHVYPIKANENQWNVKGLEVDHVIHCAGIIFGTTENEYKEINCEGTLKLLRELKDPKKTVLISSHSATGPCKNDSQVKTEKDTDEPLTWYGKSKLLMEKKVREEFPHLNILSLRPPMIFGARDKATLPLFKMVKRPIWFKPGFKTKAYSIISVSDLVEATFKCLSMDWPKTHAHYFVCSDEIVSDLDIITYAAKVSGSRGAFVKVPQPLIKLASQVIGTIPTWRATIPTLSADRAKEIWPNRWVISSQSFQKTFSWKAKQSFPSAIEETYQWYVKNHDI